MDTRESEADGFFNLVRRIVELNFPDELVPFDLEGSNLVNDLYGGREIRSTTTTPSGEFKFISEATAVLSFVGLLWSTYEVAKKVLLELKKRQKNETVNTRPTIKSEWLAKLREAGIDEDRSLAIVDSFSDDLLQILGARK